MLFTLLGFISGFVTLSLQVPETLKDRTMMLGSVICTCGGLVIGYVGYKIDEFIGIAPTLSEPTPEQWKNLATNPNIKIPILLWK
jgi:hypothetical protein